MDDLRWPTYPPRETYLETVDEPGGFRVRDSSGKVYLDAVGGIGCCPLGHGHPRWMKAIQTQMGRLTAASNSYRTAPQQKLADMLIHRFPIREARVFLASTGTEATEAALKVALKATGKDTVIAFTGAFHGRTMGSLSLTANPKYRQPYIRCEDEPQANAFATMRVIRLPFNDLDAVSEAFRLHAKRIALVCVEPVQGESGIFPASREFLLHLRELCSKHGALLGCDEIQCGSGRTGKWTGWQAIVGDDAQPDILWLAKALGAGFPVSACLTAKDIAQKMGVGSHGTTFGGNPIACAAGIATLEILEEEGLLESAGRQLETLQAIAKEKPIPQVSEIRGRGAMIGIQVGEREQQSAKALGDKMAELGALVTVPGGHTVRLLFPYRAGRAELEEIWGILRSAIDSTIAG